MFCGFCLKDNMKSNKCVLACGRLALAWVMATSSAAAWQLQYAPLLTGWAQLVDTNNPLPEYPQPQMVRSNWLNLNGLWQFQAGATNDPVPTNKTLSGDILDRKSTRLNSSHLGISY